MKQFQSWLTVGLVLMLAATAHAKAAYKDKVEMTQSAEVIAIVEIKGLQKVEVKGKFWTYHQKASDKVEKVLKGTLPSTVALFGDEDFICARCHFGTGRYLVFLDKDGELLTGNNWQLSARKITGTDVEWFGEKNVFEQKKAPLSNVLSEIGKLLTSRKTG